MKIKSTVVCGIAAIAFTALMTSCSHPSSKNSGMSSAAASHACSANEYLMKYNCSITRIQTAAENGSADAQYALGYMYYYGIGTVQDQQTADLWIQRSAAQGQPLAKKAWALINSGATFTDLHQAASGHDVNDEKIANDYTSRNASTIVQQEPVDVDNMNKTVPTEPITNHLPAYQTTTPSESMKNTPGGVTSGTSSETSSSSNSSSSASTPPIALHKPVHDPRLSSNSKPIIASLPQSERFAPAPQSSQFAPSVKPAKMALNTVNAAPASEYTVQLLASDKLSDIKNFISAHNLGSKAAYFRTTLDGKPWYMLTYGQYRSVAQAQSALQNMPANLQNHHPWIKPVAVVQKEVRLQKVIA